MIVKGHNRDTAWYAITEDEWPAIRAGMQAWLGGANFDARGSQKQTLAELISEARRDAPRGSAASNAG